MRLETGQVPLDGGDHSFALPKRMRRAARSVWEEIVTVTVTWIEAMPSATAVA